MEELRLYCIMRSDLNMISENGFVPLGKLCAQAGHAFIGCFSKLNEEQINSYINYGDQPKITLRAKNEKDLLRAVEECETAGINHYLVKDAGRTVFKEQPTITCLGVGPISRSNLPKFIQRMQLFEKMQE